MRRISVVGNSGSGKTRSAGAIADRLDVPHLELDSIYHLPGWVPMPDAEFRERVSQFVADDGWVVDGNYSIVSDLIWGRADAVVWLDMPRSTVMRQVVTRTLRPLKNGEALWNENRERWLNLIDPRPDRNIILWAWTRHRDVRRRYGARLADGSWGHLDVYRLQRSAEIDSFLDQLG